jgi:hypothetical protein
MLLEQQLYNEAGILDEDPNAWYERVQAASVAAWYSMPKFYPNQDANSLLRGFECYKPWIHQFNRKVPAEVLETAGIYIPKDKAIDDTTDWKDIKEAFKKGSMDGHLSRDTVDSLVSFPNGIDGSFVSRYCLLDKYQMAFFYIVGRGDYPAKVQPKDNPALEAGKRIANLLKRDETRDRAINALSRRFPRAYLEAGGFVSE